MKILVTGGCGFIGYHLVERLVHVNQVTVVDDCSQPNPKFVPQAYYRIMDINDIDTIYEKFDIIYHLAAVSSITECSYDPKRAIDTNIKGTVSVLNKAVNDKSHFIFASTCAVYGGDLSLYSMSKSVGEKLCNQYKEFDLKSTIFRISNVYGENGQKGILHKIEDAANKMDVISLIGGGTNFRNYVHVEDVVSALTSDNRNDVFDIFTNDYFTAKDLISKIKEVQTKNVKMEAGHNYSITPGIQTNIIQNWAPKHKLVDYIEEINQRLDDFVPF